MGGYLPWDKTWSSQIIYLPWIQPEIPGMEQSPVLPSYPIFIDSLRHCANGMDFFTAIAGAMVFLLGHEPDAAVNARYCQWLRVFNGELATQLFYDGTEMTARYDLPQAVWMLQASLLLEPESYETHYNLALTFNQLATKLMKEEKHREAGDCYRQAKQYFRNAEQLRDAGSVGSAGRIGGEQPPDEGYDTGLHGDWQR
ncbi:MAG: hypothetical protein FWG28_03160 [Clostridiales bacterium]|nr:hypothetical protein [Clostridiales bacterium]